jgi:hypothetical protein
MPPAAPAVVELVEVCGLRRGVDVAFSGFCLVRAAPTQACGLGCPLSALQAENRFETIGRRVGGGGDGREAMGDS